MVEHIPEIFEKFFLNNLARTAKQGVIFSWARPGQRGHSHVNEKPMEYVLEQMSSRGLKLNRELSKKIKEESSQNCFKKNLNAFEISVFLKNRLRY